MNKAFIFNLEGTYSGNNLPLFDAIEFRISNNGSKLQNVNIHSSEAVDYIIKDDAFSFADLDGNSRSEYSHTANAGRSLYGDGYEIPADAVGTMLVKNIFNIYHIISTRGKFEVDVENLLDLRLLNKLEGVKLKGDISEFYHNELTKLSLHGNDVYGTLVNYDTPQRYTELIFSNTKVSGEIDDFGRFTSLTKLWLTSSKVTGTVESLVASFVNNGKTSGTVNLAVNYTNVTYQGRKTDKGADLIWNGVNNITYNCFNS